MKQDTRPPERGKPSRPTKAKTTRKPAGAKRRGAATGAASSPIEVALDATQAAVKAWVRVSDEAFTDDDTKTIARALIAAWFAVVSGDSEEAGRLNRHARDYIHKQRKIMQRRDDRQRSAVTFDDGDRLKYQAWAIDPCEWDKGRRLRILQRIVMDALKDKRSADGIARLLIANEAASVFDAPPVEGDQEWTMRVWDTDWSPPTSMVKEIERTELTHGRKALDERAEKIIIAAVAALGAPRQRATGMFKRNALDTR